LASLLGRLERRLEGHDRAALNGLAHPAVSAEVLATAFRGAFTALDTAAENGVERAGAFEQLEDAVIELATLGVQSAITVGKRGSPDQDGGPPAMPDDHELLLVLQAARRPGGVR
jgi:hypothetical protein